MKRIIFDNVNVSIESTISHMNNLLNKVVESISKGIRLKVITTDGLLKSIITKLIGTLTYRLIKL